MRTKIIFLSIILFAFLFASESTYSQSLFVWGNVKWVTGNPAMGVEVRLIHTNGQQISSTYTNQSGVYAFYGIAGQPSNYYILTYYNNNFINKTMIPEVPVGQQLSDIWINKILRINSVVDPPNIATGIPTTISVYIYDETGQAVPNAYVTLSSGGGKFLREGEDYDFNGYLHGPFEVSGVTNPQGNFTTYWVCKPCANGYVLSIKCNKQGYIPGMSELTINVVQ